jgi:hypothetical protein
MNFFLLFLFYCLCLEFVNPQTLNDNIPIQSVSATSGLIDKTSLHTSVNLGFEGLKQERKENEENIITSSNTLVYVPILSDDTVPRNRITGRPLIRLGPAGPPESGFVLPDFYEYPTRSGTTKELSFSFSDSNDSKTSPSSLSLVDLNKEIRRPRRLDCFAANVTAPKKGDVWQTTETHYVRWNAECGDEGNEDEPTFNFVCIQLRYLDTKTNTWYAAGGEGGLGTIAQLDGKYNQQYLFDTGKYMPIGLDSGTFQISLRDALCAFKIANSETFTIKTYAAIPLNIALIVGLSSLALVLLCILSCYCAWRRCKPGCCWFDDPLSLWVMRKYAEHLKFQEEVQAAKRLREEEERDLRERRKLEFKMREASKMRFGQWGAPGFEVAPLPEALKYSVARLKAQEALAQARDNMEVINVRGVADILLSEEERKKLIQQRKALSEKDVEVNIDVGETEGLLSREGREEEEEGKGSDITFDANNSSIIELQVITVPPVTDDSMKKGKGKEDTLGMSLPPLSASKEDDSLFAARARLAAARRSSRGEGTGLESSSSPLDPSVFGADRLRVSPTSWEPESQLQSSSSFTSPAEAALFGDSEERRDGDAKDSKEGEFMFDSAAPADDTPPVQPVVMLGSRRTSQGSTLLGHHLPILGPSSSTVAGGGLQGSRRASTGTKAQTQITPFPPIVPPPSSPRGEGEAYTDDEEEALRAIEEADRAEREAAAEEGNIEALADRIRLHDLETQERKEQTELFKADAMAARMAAQAAKAKSEEEIAKAHKSAADARLKAEEDMQRARDAANEARQKAEDDMQRARDAANEARQKAEDELAATLSLAAESARLAEEAEKKRIAEAEVRAQARAEALAVAAKARADAQEALAAKERARIEAIEARRLAEEESKAKLELEAAHARRLAEEEAVRKAKEEAESARLAAQEAALAASLSARKREEEQERERIVALENQRKAEIAAQRKIESELATAKAAAEAKREAEAIEEMERAAVAETIRIAQAEAEQAALAAQEAMARTSREREEAHQAALDAKMKADEEIQEAHRIAEEARLKVEEESKLVHLAVIEAKKKAEEDAMARMAAFEAAQKAREEQEALEIAMEEERVRLEEETKRIIEQEAVLEALRLEEEEKKKARMDELAAKETERLARIEMEQAAAAAAKSKIEMEHAIAAAAKSKIEAEEKSKTDALDLARKIEEERLEKDAFDFATIDDANKNEETLKQQERLRSRIPEPKRRISRASTGSTVLVSGPRIPSRRSSGTGISSGDKEVLPTGIPLPSNILSSQSQPNVQSRAPVVITKHEMSVPQSLPLLRRLDSPDSIRSMSPSPSKEFSKATTTKPTLDLGEGSIMEIGSIGEPPKPGRFAGLSMDGSIEQLPSPSEGAYLGKQYASESPAGSVYSAYTEDDRIGKKGKLGLVRVDHEEGESEGGAFWHLGLDASRSDVSPRLLDSRGSLGGRQGSGADGEFRSGGNFYDEEGGVPMLTDDLFDHLADVIDEAQGDLLTGKGASQKQWKEHKARLAEEDRRRQIDNLALRTGPHGGASSIGSVDMLLEEEGQLINEDEDASFPPSQAINIGMRPYQSHNSSITDSALQAPVVVGGSLRARPVGSGDVGTSAFGAGPSALRPVPQQYSTAVTAPQVISRPVAQQMAAPVASRPSVASSTIASKPYQSSSQQPKGVAQSSGQNVKQTSPPAQSQTAAPTATRRTSGAGVGVVTRPAPSMPSGPPPARPVVGGGSSTTKSTANTKTQGPTTRKK